MRRALRILVAVGLGWTCFAVPAASQSEDVQGVIRDQESRHPVATALVTVVESGRYTLTDAAGAFALHGVSGEEATLLVQRLGYQDLRITVHLPQSAPLVASLVPDPVVLEGLDVVVDVLERRRKAIHYQVDVLGPDRILDDHISDTYELINHRLLHFYPCPGQRYGVPACVHYAARIFKPGIYLDELPLDDGLNVLRTVPITDLQTVEVIQGGKQVRIYTKRFMEKVARNPALLEKVIWIW